jgi:putative endonuclease
MATRGDDAENLAGDFLQRAGLKLVTRNYRCRFGEIDLIAHDGKTLAFVEVRMRSSDRYGGAAATITAAKRANSCAQRGTTSRMLHRHPHAASTLCW